MLLRFRLKNAIIFYIICTMLVLNTVPVYGAAFSDISGYWARDSILRLASMQIVSGYNGKFNPSGGVTRAEFTAMIVKALGLADQAEIVKGTPTGYTDVGPDHWAAGFIVIAKERGIISGYPDNNFKPSAPIRRDEITSVLVRALGFAPAPDMDDPAEVFADGGNIPLWAAEAVKIAFNYKLISGFPDNTFSPQKNATRGETASLIERILRQLNMEFTFYGKVLGVNQAGRVLTIDIHGQSETFTYVPGVEVRIAGKPSTPGELQLGSNVSFILDQDGNINFIQAEDVLAKAQSLTTAPPAKAPQMAAELQRATAEKSEAGISTGGIVSIIAVTTPGKAGQVDNLIRSAGGNIRFTNQEINLVCANISAALYEKLKASPLIEEITINRPIKVKDVISLADESLENPTPVNPGSSLNVTKEAIKAPEFVRVTRADGKNQVIAVIDTGVDAGHPDLQKTSDNKPKIVDWQDFTGDGDIDTSSTAKPSDQLVYLANGIHYLGGITSAGGQIRYGYFREMDIVDVNGNGFDLNFNGAENDVFALILVDSTEKGVFDTVYMDSNGNKDFSDEKPLQLFSASHKYASFTSDNGQDRINVVLSEIAADYSGVNLGFDGNDHGTHVAGIASANGKIKGVAPGAQVMALKVLDSAGYGDLITITEAMTYAASHGAKIINLSLGFPVGGNNGGGIPTKLLDNLTEKYGVVFVVAAGNEGPGLSTVAAPGDARAALSVGAFTTPEMWKTQYGWDVPNESLWFFSSMGPRRDGAVSPSVVAPGSVMSTVPLRNGQQYFLSEGTSMAAPHLSGAIALLMEVVDREKLDVTPHGLKRAIELGARQIDGYQPAEQGYGAVNLTMSWAELLAIKKTDPYLVKTSNLESTEGAGIFFRDGLPQKTTVYLTNNSDSPTNLKLNGSSWIKPEQSEVNLPAGKTRAVDVNIATPGQKGLSSAFIRGDNVEKYGDDLEIMTTVINPYNLSTGNGYLQNISDTEAAAQFKRYFYKLPAGAESLEVKLTVPQAAGRSKVFLYSPQGRLERETDFAGVNPGGSRDTVTASVNYPAAGVWEVVVYTSAGLSAYSLRDSAFSLDVRVQGVQDISGQQSNRNVIIGVLPKNVTSGRINYVTVQVRDRITKKPFEGFIMIDGGLYFSRGGHVTLPVPVENSGRLVVTTTVESPLEKPWEFNFPLPTQG
ncbi:MAG: S8 family serine peptidase [Thermincola sp.]|jgi:subtilisin family serine protease|nr:S8 family serine peptidase [Thermincola sp.]MDT3703424.1 S8 family serine peptidase [Thermincola sp.]